MKRNYNTFNTSTDQNEWKLRFVDLKDGEVCKLCGFNISQRCYINKTKTYCAECYHTLNYM